MKARFVKMFRRFDFKNRREQDMERLIDRFFNGDTTLGEERRLYRFFAHPGVPPRFERYRGLFAGFASMPAVPARGGRPVVTVLWRAAAGISAAVLIFICVSVYMDVRERQLLARTYGGSYVIMDGRRIDDLSEIKDDIETALSAAEKIEDGMSGRNVVEKAEQDVLGSIDDPAERKRISEMLND